MDQHLTNVNTSMGFRWEWAFEQTPLVRFLSRCDDNTIRESRTRAERRNPWIHCRAAILADHSLALSFFFSLSLPRASSRSLLRALSALKNAPNHYFSHPRWRSSLTTLPASDGQPRTTPPPQSGNYWRRGRPRMRDYDKSMIAIGKFITRLARMRFRSRGRSHKRVKASSSTGCDHRGSVNTRQGRTTRPIQLVAW